MYKKVVQHALIYILFKFSAVLYAFIVYGINTRLIVANRVKESKILSLFLVK